LERKTLTRSKKTAKPPTRVTNGREGKARKVSENRPEEF